MNQYKWEYEQDWDFQFTAGIPANEADQQPPNLQKVRQAISRAKRMSPIVRQVMIYAENEGLSGEDTYALLAYCALRHLQDTSDRLAQTLDRVVMEKVKNPLISP